MNRRHGATALAAAAAPRPTRPPSLGGASASVPMASRLGGGGRMPAAGMLAASNLSGPGARAVAAGTARAHGYMAAAAAGGAQAPLDRD